MEKIVVLPGYYYGDGSVMSNIWGDFAFFKPEIFINKFLSKIGDFDLKRVFLIEDVADDVLNYLEKESDPKYGNFINRLKEIVFADEKINNRIKNLKVNENFDKKDSDVMKSTK